MRTAYVFPGQGSQYVGMGRDLYDGAPAARKVFERANEVLGFDLARLCFDGPEEELRETRNTQPAIFVHSLAVLAVLGWELGGEEACFAGHSLGEYTAYVAAGALGFEDALRVVRRRGELMFEAGTVRPGAMAAILGLDGSTVEARLGEIPGIVVPANFNSPSQVVISGEVASVEAAMKVLKEAGAKRVLRLDVSGAFHSPLLTAAADGLAEALRAIEIRTPRGDVFANESAKPVNEPEPIRASLEKQLLSPVRWEESVRAMIATGAGQFVEVGPGKVLSGLVRAIDRGPETQAIGTLEQVLAQPGTLEERR